MRKIIIVQHCQSEHHMNNMSGGWTDTPLTELGRKQANLIGYSLASKLKLKAEGVERREEAQEAEDYTLYSSDLLRARQTAEIIGCHLNLKISEDCDLREINTGIAAGKTKEWASEHRNPRTGTDFDLDYQEFEDGETWRQFYKRVCDCMDRICSTGQKKLILVTHGGTLAYIIAWWLKFQPQMLAKAYFSASPGSISYLHDNNYNQNVLSVLNDTAHLRS